MILGQRCSNTSPFDPGSWKAPLRPPLDSYTRHGIIRRIRVPGNAIVRKKDLIEAVGEFVIPCTAWRAVNLADIAKAPLDLSSRVGQPVRAGGGHLVPGQ